MNDSELQSAPLPAPLPLDELRWRCDPASLPFETTEELEPEVGVIGQDTAVDALRFGITSRGPGQNVFVRGLAGTGRMTLVRRLLEEHQPVCRPAPDRCYVHNFREPERPTLITLPRGKGQAFQRQIDRLIEVVTEELPGLAEHEDLRQRRAGMEERFKEELRRLGEPFDAELREAKLTVVMPEGSPGARPMIVPVIEDRPITPELFAKMRQEGRIDDAEAERIANAIDAFSERFERLTTQIRELNEKHREEVRAFLEHEMRKVLDQHARHIRTLFEDEAIARFLAGLTDDALHQLLSDSPTSAAFTARYRVNLLSSADGSPPCPTLIENAPMMRNLLGSFDRPTDEGKEANHMLIRAGSLLRADGGYLIMEARDVLGETGAWKALVRTLRTGRLEIAPSEVPGWYQGPMLVPEPIEIDVKVILLGDPGLYGLLDEHDPDFSHLFKVLVDFDVSIPNDELALRQYAGVLARIGNEEELLPFHRSAVAELAEHGARMAARQDRLSTRFGRLADIAREAVFLAREQGLEMVRSAEVRQALRRGRQRADLPARRFQNLISEGTLRIQTRGTVVGQVNGLAVVSAGPLTYGFPSRITATIGPGHAGAVNIEREARLSGAIHTKGFYILGGLLRHLLRTDHPLAFSASLAFEQSYGGIDGDSASGAEACCLLSALTGIPIRQGIAMTGAIDQLGHVQAVGAVTEKIEGFFSVCEKIGFSGHQGVIIPRANARDLMLSPEVVEACDTGLFQIWAVDTVKEALQILTGVEPGERLPDGRYPDGTLLRTAHDAARRFWQLAVARGPEVMPPPDFA